MKCYYQGTYCLCAISFGNSSARSSHTLNGSPRRWEAFHQPCGNLHECLRLSRLERSFKEVKGGEETEMERQLLEYEAWIKWFTLEQLLIRSWSCTSQGASEVTLWWCVIPVNIFLCIYVMLARETVGSSATYLMKGWTRWVFFGIPLCIFFTIWFEKFKFNYYNNLMVNVLVTVTSVKGSRKSIWKGEV